LLGVGYQSNRRFDLTGLWSSDARLEEIAIMLHSRPEISSSNYKRLAFVAHSMGGLVVQQALVSYEDLRNRTSHVVLFGTPSGGLTKARFASFWKRQIQNMEAEGPFIQALREEWTSLKLDSDPPFVFVAVAGETDQFVPPESSLGRFPQSKGDVIPGNHLTMLDAESPEAPCVQKILQIQLPVVVAVHSGEASLCYSDSLLFVFQVVLDLFNRILDGVVENCFFIRLEDLRIRALLTVRAGLDARAGGIAGRAPEDRSKCPV
jgi:hypothetical protein